MSITDLPNGRDLGGHRTASGRLLRSGLVFRSAALSDPDYVPTLEALGISHVYDLRTAAERENRPDLLPDSVTEIHADLLADQPDAGPATLGRIARAALAGDTSVLSVQELDDTFVRGYRSFVTMGSARAAARQVLAQVVDPDGARVVLHCTAGKDRTGWLTALLLTALDVPWDDVMADYLASGPAVAALFAPYRDQFAARGGDVRALERAIGVYPHYLEASFDTMRQEYGSLDVYLTDGLGLPSDIRDQLARRLLD